jgi:SprT protein
VVIPEKATYSEVLSEYLPEYAVPTIVQWLQYNNDVQLRITRKRSSKLGDYRPPIHYNYHIISVNYDLNPYHFLLTLVHEMAHMKAWNKFKNKVKPHGTEWKQAFISLMKPFLNSSVFPEELLPHIIQYMSNPSSSTSTSQLLIYLRNYDPEKHFTTLADIPDSSYFSISNGIVFQKLSKIRKRFKCKRLDNNRIYLINPMIFVNRVDKNEAE